MYDERAGKKNVRHCKENKNEHHGPMTSLSDQLLPERSTHY